MDFCVCCGAYVPEGTMVCLECRRKYLSEEKDFPEMSGEILTKSNAGFQSTEGIGGNC